MSGSKYLIIWSKFATTVIVSIPMIMDLHHTINTRHHHNQYSRSNCLHRDWCLTTPDLITSFLRGVLNTKITINVISACMREKRVLMMDLNRLILRFITGWRRWWWGRSSDGVHRRDAYWRIRKPCHTPLKQSSCFVGRSHRLRSH